MRAADVWSAASPAIAITTGLLPAVQDGYKPADDDLIVSAKHAGELMVNQAVPISTRWALVEQNRNRGDCSDERHDYRCR